MDLRCNICNSSSLDLILTFSNYPLNSIYINDLTRDIYDKYYPRNLHLLCCTNCLHFQTHSDIDICHLYGDGYNYSTNNSGVQGRIDFFLNQLGIFKEIKFNRVIDIGCFDTSLLKKIKGQIAANYFIGIDPSLPNELLNNNEGIICFKEYCDNVDLPYYVSELPDLVISDQTLEHIPRINKLLDGIIRQLSNNSFFAVCVPSMEVLIEKLNFHNIIHEHINYFTIQSLTNLFGNHKLSLNSFKLTWDTSCGFLFALYSKNYPIIELRSNIYTKTYLLMHYNFFKDSITKCNKIVALIKNENILGFGASDITPNLAYFMNTDFSFLDYILDDTAYKQNTYFPFSKPKIISPNNLKNIKDYNCLITAPQATRQLYSRLNGIGFKKIINPLGLIS